MLHATLPLNALRMSNLWVRSLDQLEVVLTDDSYHTPSDWTRALADALVYLHLAMRQHRAMGRASDGLFAEVDETRPTLARHVDGLRKQHDDFLEEIHSLREEVSLATRTLSASAGFRSINPAKEIATSIRLHRRASRLLAGLLRNSEAETSLIFDSINTDIGAGD